MGTSSSSPSCATPRLTTESPEQQRLGGPSDLGDGPPGSSLPFPPPAQGVPGAAGLERRTHKVRAAPGCEMGLQVPQQAPGDRQPVRSPVQGQVVPPVPVARTGRRWQIGGIAEDEVEPPQPGGQVGAYRFNGEALAPGPRMDEPQGRGIEIRDHDPPGAPAGRGQGRQSATRPDLQNEVAPSGPGEAGQETRVLSDRVDLRGAFRARTQHVSRSDSRRVPKSS